MEFLGTEELLINKRRIPYRYEVNIKDIDADIERVLEHFKDNTRDGLYYITSDYMTWLLYYNEFKDNRGRTLGVKTYVYEEGIMFPIVTIDGQAIVDFSGLQNTQIDFTYLDMKDKNEWLEYICKTFNSVANNYADFINNEDNLSFYDTQTGIRRREYYEDTSREDKLESKNIKRFGPTETKDNKTKNIYSNNNLNLDEIEVKEERPFKYDKYAERLLIPRNSEPANFNLTLKLMRELIKEYGVCMNVTETRDYFKNLNNKVSNYEDSFKQRYNLRLMPSASARKFDENHPHCLILRDIGENPGHYPYKKNNTISFTKPTRKFLLEKIKSEMESGNPKNRNQDSYEILKSYNEYLDILTGPLKIGRPIYQASLGNDRDMDYELDIDNDILTFYGDLNLVKTMRITTSNPNFQGMPTDIKRLIKGRNENKKILTIDIKAQEVMILIFGILKNKTLKDLVLVNGDPYKSFAICAGLCGEEDFTEELKELIKVPVLSVMNGKSKGNIIAEMRGNEKVAETILKLITEDPGYLDIVKIARKEQKRCKESGEYGVMRRGLFGTKVQSQDPGDKRGSAYTQSLNANFQVTAAEIVSYGLTSMILDLKDKSNKHGLSIEQMTPLLPIYDEVVIEYDKDKEKEVIDLATFYLCPQVEGWLELSGDISVGENYG